MAIIELKDVSFAYSSGTEHETQVLDNFSLSVEEGEFVALVGHNGSGKSTIARLLNGLRQPSSGTVMVDGKLTSNSDDIFDIRKTVGVVFQNPDNQMIATIIEDDLAFGPENIGLPPQEIEARIDWALAAVGMSEHRKGTPFRLSGGQKQRIAIAGVLAIRPRVLVLDESTSMLDPSGRREVLDVIRRLNKTEKMTIIMITHFMEEALDSDRIVVLDKGRIAMQGGNEIFERHEELESMGLDVPYIIDAAIKLRQRGIAVSMDITSVKELVAELCR